MGDNIKIEKLRFQVPWGHVAAKAWGSPQNSPVLLVHGVMDNAGSYNRLIPLLPKNFYYVCIDLPNHGLSSDFPLNVPIELLNYILCIRIVLEALNWKSCDVIGHSYGGLVLLFYLTLYPEKIKQFIAIDIVLSPRKNVKLPVNSFIRKNQSNFLKLIRKDKSLQLFSYDDLIYDLQCKRFHYTIREAAEALFKRLVTRVKSLYKFNHDPNWSPLIVPSITFDQWRSLHEKCKIPIFFIFSSISWQFFESNRPEDLKVYVKNRKNSQYIIVEGNHYVHLNQPERVAPHVERILENIVTSKL